MCQSDGPRLKRCKAMAKYSKSFYANLENADLEKAHIFLDYNKFTFLISIKSQSNKAARLHCKKLNNAAPKQAQPTK